MSRPLQASTANFRDIIESGFVYVDKTNLETFFANVPYDIQLKHEKYYQTIFCLIFKLIGLTIDAEARTNRGRIDAVVELDNHIYLFEFKLDGTAEDALEQIKKTEYAQKYQLRGKPMTFIGANFDSKERNIADWKHKTEST